VQGDLRIQEMMRHATITVPVCRTKVCDPSYQKEWKDLRVSGVMVYKLVGQDFVFQFGKDNDTTTSRSLAFPYIFSHRCMACLPEERMQQYVEVTTL
jgi:hypothetical protein